MIVFDDVLKMSDFSITLTLHVKSDDFSGQVQDNIQYFGKIIVRLQIKV